MSTAASSLDHGKLKQRRAGSRGGFGWKPKEGENRIRVLPPHSRYLTAWGEMEDIAVKHRLHYFRIEGRPGEVSLCLEEMKQRCPACEMWRAWRKSEDPGMKERAKQIAPADQYLLNIIDLNNMQSGIQYWGANYTCWDKILEIVANPAWGNVLDPANGVNFQITLTPGAKSKTGFNQYSVMPEPQRTSILDALAADQQWREKLDGLEEQGTEPKEADEIHSLLDEMGFPPLKGRVVGASTAHSAPYTPPVTSTVAQSAPAPAPVAPAPAPVAAPPAPVQAQPVATQSVATGVHYDPGPSYTPKIEDAARPAGAPRCWGDYNPAVHRCDPCPQKTNCQMKCLGIS